MTLKYITYTILPTCSIAFLALKRIKIKYNLYLYPSEDVPNFGFFGPNFVKNK